MTRSLGINRVRSKGARAIAEALKINSTLTIVKYFFLCVSLFLFFPVTLSSSSSSPSPLPKSPLFLSHTRFAHSLGYNKIRDEGARAIAEALKINVTLKDIKCVRGLLFSIVELWLTRFLTACAHSLRANSIGAEGARAIAEALKSNTTLTTIGYV